MFVVIEKPQALLIFRQSFIILGTIWKVIKMRQGEFFLSPQFFSSSLNKEEDETLASFREFN
jgi:hypothetical protein